jgi:hypothetical protein
MRRRPFGERGSGQVGGAQAACGKADALSDHRVAEQGERGNASYKYETCYCLDSESSGAAERTAAVDIECHV